MWGIGGTEADLVFVRLVFFGALILAALVGWSWLRSQRSTWIARRRGVVGWSVAALIFVFIATVLKALLPRF